MLIPLGLIFASPPCSTSAPKGGRPNHVRTRYDDGLPRSSIHRLSTITPPLAGASIRNTPAFIPPEHKRTKTWREKVQAYQRQETVDPTQPPQYAPHKLNRIKMERHLFRSFVYFLREG